MENISLLVSLAFVVLFGYFLARMVWDISQNLVQGRLVRRQLSERLAGLPLEQALGRAGTHAARYLHTQHIHAIECEMRNCVDCPATHECKEALNSGTPAEQFDFCPNRKTLFTR